MAAGSGEVKVAKLCFKSSAGTLSSEASPHAGNEALFRVADEG